MIRQETIDRLRQLVGDRHVLTDYEDRLCYVYDATHLTGAMPDVVVYPGTTQEVSEIMKVANSERIPVFPRGSGTGIAGSAIPTEGGMVLCTKRMNRILEIDVENLTATVEPGVITSDLQREAEKVGLFYAPDPQSMDISTIGGNVASSAGGPRGVKYGATNAYVIGLEVVLADGRVLRTGNKCVKQSSGYKLAHLFVGSEGTLGVITQITVRLIPKPETKKTMLCVFDRLQDAAITVSKIIAKGIIPCTLELMDNQMMKAIEAFKPCGLPVDAAAILIIECDGDADSVGRQIAQIAALAQELGVREVKVAETGAEADRIWAGRKAAFGVAARLRPSCIVEDVTVPRNRFVEMVNAIREASDRHNIQTVMLAHAGDGNMHPLITCDARDQEEMSRVALAFEEIVRAALSLGGTLSGEHGIGLLKKDYMVDEVGEVGVSVMQAIKNTLDPNGILNPGKIWGKGVR